MSIEKKDIEPDLFSSIYVNLAEAEKISSMIEYWFLLNLFYCFNFFEDLKLVDSLPFNFSDSDSINFLPNNSSSSTTLA